MEGLNSIAPGQEATAGVAPEGESAKGKDEHFDFFRALMETNTPPPGIGTSNKDWIRGVD